MPLTWKRTGAAGRRTPDSGLDWRAGSGRIRCLYGREAGLQREGEHRAVAQLVQPVVVVPELLDQHPPPGRVQQVLEEKGRGAADPPAAGDAGTRSLQIEGNRTRHHASG